MMKKFKKIKLVKGGGLELHFNDPIISGSETYGRTIVEKSTVDIHPDLKTALDALKPEFALATNRTFIINELIAADEFSATKEQAQYLEKARIELFQKIKINGISVKGTEEKPILIIHGEMKSPKGKSVDADNPSFELSKNDWGTEEDLKEKMELIVSEALEYTLGKQAQLEIAFEEN